MGDRLLASIAFPGGFILRYSKLGRSMLSFFDFNPRVLASKYLFLLPVLPYGHNGGVIFFCSCMICQW